MNKFVKCVMWLAALGVIALLVVFTFFYSQQENNTLVKARAASVVGQLIELPSGTCHYELTGNEEDPLIVLVHGGSVTGMSVWNHNVAFLNQKGFRVLRFDLYGRGLSDFQDPLSLEIYQDQLVELLSALEINDSFHMAGLSMGAMVVAEFVEEHEDRVRSMSLFAPAAMGLYKAHWTLRTPILNDFMVRVYWMPRAVEKQMAEFYRSDEHQDYADLIKEGTMIDGFKAATLSIWLDVMTNDAIADLEEIGKSNKVPAAVFFGKEDHLIPPSMAERYQEVIPNIDVHVISEAGHMPQYENSEKVHPLLLSFLKENQPADTLTIEIQPQ